MKIVCSYSSLKQVYFLLLLFLLTACDQHEEENIPAPSESENQHMVKYEYLQTFEKDQILMLASFPALKDYKDYVKYGIELYRVSYFTTYQDRKIQASGLLCIPKDLKEEAPLLAGLHGTIIKNSQAPTNFKNISDMSRAELFASMGFITAIPDYIGFGDSEDIFHPYYDYLHSGRAVTDMLLATREFLDELEIPYQNNLFITGYSEGGYTAVATLKYLEGSDIDFNLKATAAGAGGYNIKDMMKYVLEKKRYNAPAYLVYIIYAYNLTNNWNRPLTDFFREPYASQIPAFANGSSTIGEINGQLPENLEELLNPEFLRGLKEGTEIEFIEAVKQNSVNDWAPRSPIRLYHEKDDEIIPIANSEETYKSMIYSGAEHTAFFPYDDATSHGSGYLPMYKMAVPWFLSLKD